MNGNNQNQDQNTKPMNKHKNEQRTYNKFKLSRP